MVSRIDIWALRCPIERPVETSFGRMYDRPAVFVRVEAADGCFGWGEIFANWPAAGAEHRVNLLARDIAPLILGQKVDSPDTVFDALTRQTHIRALQCSEWGPFRQVLAGIDTALWDLKARSLGLPLRVLLNADASNHVPAYASGIHVNAAKAELPALRAMGYKAIKVKVGFDTSSDIENLTDLSQSLNDKERLFADANQAFDVTRACHFLDASTELGLGWLEEPIPADAPPSDWERVAARSSTPLAGGENIAGEVAFDEVLQHGVLDIVQPDLAKWGGVTGCVRVAKAAVEAGRIYCPHFLGGGIGLVASAEVLAAVGGGGLLEVDVNPNPLRQAFAIGGIDANTGLWDTGPSEGLGIETLPESLLQYVTHSVSV
ncbi:mandelate racemase/muconate lactonizing enzyme family protein [Lutimaribacter marinistellae]|uniref:Mandelate racemase/muconate lactonizing enzyme family protein n=1 Tax=Lutimaribacter marinistellae TaxID=1820329 RepID=A0ABV7TNM7_9RHOB